jgi:predicted SnoaL-like aldol condensation-catalyzing enzyme
LPATLRYENHIAAGINDFVILHRRFSGHGLSAAWVVADIMRMEDGVLAEHWDVIRESNRVAVCRCSATNFRPDRLRTC